MEVTWTKEQEACLNYRGDKHLMVKGVAGSGKSLVIEAYARKLLEEYSADQKNRVVIFTFSNTLSSAMKELLSVDEERSAYILVTTLHSYLAQVYREIGGPRRNICRGNELKKQAAEEALEQLKKTNRGHRFCKLDTEFWIEEFDWLKDMDVASKDLEYYLSLPRKGRGARVRMTASERLKAFDLFVLYEQIMERKHLGDWADYARYLIRHEKEISDSLKFDHVLIDEAQDLSLAQMKAAMLFFRKDMVIAMDMNQRIFDKQWTPKLLGIETTTKKLTRSMRTTVEIDNLAESLRRKNDAILSEDDRSVHAIPQRHGSVPRLVHLEDTDSEKKFVIKQVKKYLEDETVSIGIIAAQNSQMGLYASWLTDAGIAHEMIQRDSKFSVLKPGVKIVNAYNAKGLEFVRVIIPQFTEGNFPYRCKEEDEERFELFMTKCRNLVYVGMTRARYSLLLTYSGAHGSRFIGEMDENCYEAVGLPIVYEQGMGLKQKKPDLNVELPMMAPVAEESEQGQTLVEFLKEHGKEVIDRRSEDSYLWVIGEKKELKPLIQEIGKRFGAFGLPSKGTEETGGRACWYTKCRK